MSEKIESRAKNSTRNIIVSMITYMIQVLLAFFVRRYFIFYFGAEYLGLNSLFSNVLSILSLAELGFGSALVFAMYKPMAENDEEKVRQLLQFYKKSYFIIGIIVFSLGLCVLPFMSFFKVKAGSIDVNLYVVYLIFLFNSTISYFFAHRRSLLYTSQRNDIESKINMVMNFLQYGIQLFIIIVLKNYYLYIITTGVVGLLSNLCVYVITQKKYRRFIDKPKNALSNEDTHEIKKNVGALVFHKLGTTIVYSTDSLIIYFMLGSANLGMYSNYVMITTQVATLLSIFINSIRGSIGNSIASESVEKNQQLLKRLNFIYFWIISFCTIAIFVLADPFIDKVLVKGSQNLLFEKSVLIVICLNFFFNQSKSIVGTFKECAGLFYQDRFKCIFESIINLVASIVLTKYFGIIGVVLGTIISNVLTSLWLDVYVLNKNYLHMSTIKYFVKYLLYLVIMLVVGVGTYFVCSLVPDLNIWTLVAKFAVCAVVPNLMLLAIYACLPEFKDTFAWGRQILKNLLKNKKEKKRT